MDEQLNLRDAVRAIAARHKARKQAEIRLVAAAILARDYLEDAYGMSDGIATELRTALAEYRKFFRMKT